MSDPHQSSALSLANRWPLLAYLREYSHDWPQVWLSIFLALVKHSPVLVVPLYTAHVFDHVIPNKDYAELWLCLLGATAMISLNISVHPLYVLVFSKIRREVSLRLRSRLCERIQQIAFSYHDSAQSGRLHSKVMQDVEKLDGLGRVIVDQLIIPAATAVVAGAYLVWMQPRFLWIVAVFVPVVVVQHGILSRRVQKKAAKLRTEQEKLNSDVGEMLGMLSMSRAHATEREDLRKLEHRLDVVRDVGVKTDWIYNVLGAQIWSATQMMNVAVVGMGAWLAINGSLSIGEVVLAMSLVMMTVGGISGAMSQLELFYGGAEAMRSIDEVMTYPEIERNDGKPPFPQLEGAVEFRNVSFSYPKTERPVLREVSVRVEPNKTIALVGGSGGGKTTFLKLLLGLYDPSIGEVYIDGLPIRDFDKRPMRRQVGIVSQDTFLFNGTILDNIVHGLGQVPMERVEQAARVAHAHDFISQLENGYLTKIGDRGLKLSGGQKQRIAIARALLRNPRLLLLDEATSALDSQSERVVQDALEILMKDRTTFVIAHRLSTVRNADRILVFEDGRIVEDGTHDSLLGRNGVYAKLVRLQAVG